MAGDDDLAALREQVALVSAAAISASDLDHAFQLQLAEAVQASLRAHSPNAASSSSSCGAAVLEPSSDLAYALALQADDLARAEQDRRDAQACRAAHALSAASVRVAAHDARFARELAAIPEDRWAHDGDYFERPLDQDSSSSSTARPLFRVLFKGMASDQVVGPRDRDPGVAVLAAAVCGPQGEVVLRIQKPVEMPLSLAGEEVLEAMALVEGLHAALGLGIHSVNVVTDNKLLHNYMLGIWRPTEQRLADMVNQALSVRKNFKRCEISLVQQSQVTYVVRLARDAIDVQIAKSCAHNASKEMRETCTICMEDADVTKIHAVEGCAHRFCFPCMKEHVKVKLLNGMLPACPRVGCTTKLSVEGSKESSSKYTAADAATLRVCVKCRGSFCISCVAMNSAIHVGKCGRTRKQPARVSCGTNGISSETREDEGYDYYERNIIRNQ
ncbi:hypothetical protein PR202_gb16664 [Eleusine coracana subsp. coracana]|uniref:RING-type domain-containing protein n=1 Tax=Eleusine coracana subsp. coracana TaxID=191504 RepID=A0AAV5F234_ELECO|nr:hypothetical protein PR202_gb16664 [Eleusine coracana subsp. coracana]